MKKIILISCIVLSFLQHAESQQRAQFSQYMNNIYLINPAAGGTDDYTNFKSSYRAQWVGMDGAPVSYYLSGHAPIGKIIGKRRSRNYIKRYHTTGGYVGKDVTGPTSRLNLVGSYAFNMQVQRNWRMSAGAFIGVQQYTLNSEILKFHDPGDNTAIQSVVVPDITIGILAYSKNIYVGLSISEVFQSKLNFDYTAITAKREKFSTLYTHYYLTGGIELPVNEQLAFIPSFLIKYASPTSTAIDINAKLKYNEVFWVGASYRNLDALIGILGVNIKEKFMIGYSYDATISSLNKYNSGSHEILLGVKIRGDRKQLLKQNFWQ